MALVLASSSAMRSAMLEQAGLEFDVRSPHVDEAAIKAAYQGDVPSLALALASAKALAVSGGHRGDLVIGSDSLVSVNGKTFDKPTDRTEAAAHLRSFSGRTIVLTSAVAIARDGAVEWSHCESASLHVRSLSNQFIASYLDLEWPEVASCVGVFRMEGRGVNLFDSVEGDHFTILGMPLLALLGALRTHGLASS